MEPDSSTKFFVVSGEHPTLPIAELKAILSSQRVEFKITGTEYKLVKVRADHVKPEEVAWRAGLTEEAGIEIFESSPEEEDIARMLMSSRLDNLLSPNEGFSVRVARFGGASRTLSRTKLEPFLGDIVAKKTRGRVDLRAPTKLFRGIITGEEFCFGLQTYTRPRGSIGNRRPRKRPAFHPSTMVPKLARCMVNLSQPTPGAVFMDPFCGVGGIALEACLLGCQVLGVDAVKRMLRGARRNLAHFGVSPLGLIRGDARKIPVNEVEAIATDPPYGTGASTLKSTTRQILHDFLPRAREILSQGARAVIASPVGTDCLGLAEKNGFKLLDRHLVYVHRSLTREILVLGVS